MSRKYNDYITLQSAAAQIAYEVVEQNSSKHWSGSIEDVEQIKVILKPFSIGYVDDFTGEWKKVQFKEGNK